MAARIPQLKSGPAAVSLTQQGGPLAPAPTAVGVLQSPRATTAKDTFLPPSVNMATDAPSLNIPATPKRKRGHDHQTQMLPPKRHQTRLSQLGGSTNEAGTEQQYHPPQYHLNPNTSSHSVPHSQVEVGLFSTKSRHEYPAMGAQVHSSGDQVHGSDDSYFHPADMSCGNITFNRKTTQYSPIDPQLSATSKANTFMPTSSPQPQATVLPLALNLTQEDIAIANILEAAITNRPKLIDGVRELPKAIKRGEFAAVASHLSGVSQFREFMASKKTGNTQGDASWAAPYPSEEQVIDPSLAYGPTFSPLVQSYDNSFRDFTTTSSSRTFLATANDEQTLASRRHSAGE